MNRCNLVIIMLLCVMVGASAMAQSTRRKSVKSRKTAPVSEVVAQVPRVSRDTVAVREEIDRMLIIKDYKKAVTSRVESIMMTNLTETDTIYGVEVDIDYLTTKGKQLNRRTVTFEAVVPPGETRFSSVPSWDRQQLFYHVSTPPARPTQRTTGFRVDIRPCRVIKSRKGE